MQITDLGLSVRATNCLRRAGITTVEELRQKRTWELQTIRSFGAKCMQEVREALERLDAAKPKTNADRLREMTDEEMLECLAQMPICKEKAPGCIGKEDCKDCLREWLKRTA